jgi:hypothetical protein
MARNPIDTYVDGQAPVVQTIIKRLRVLVRDTLPDLDEFLDGYGVIRYGRGRGMRESVCFISGHKAHANLGLIRGASLPDPDGLIEGTGKNMRHVSNSALWTPSSIPA